ncbi:hypothetical protein HDU92_007660 [Lobulomyces angularis]|nr:hypothetical protein HDU92_007660 [Lobulomyces angularis]
MVLPVNSIGSHTVAAHLEDLKNSGQAIPYDIIIHMGLNASSSLHNVEICALNYKVEKVDGCNFEEKLYEDGPEILSTTMNLNNSSLQKFVTSKKNNIQFSRDAGKYYCNEVFYDTVYTVIKHGLTTDKLAVSKNQCFKPKKHYEENLIPCFFLHVPLIEKVEPTADIVVELIRLIFLHV